MRSSDEKVEESQSFGSQITHRSIGMNLRQIWRWLTLVQSDDPVRYVLNHGFAAVVIFLMVADIVTIPVFMATHDAATGIALISIVPLALVWWLNRRGTVVGATLIVVWAAISIPLAQTPSVYAEAKAPIPLVLILPVVAATLFIRPQAGLWALVLLMTVHGIQLALSDVPRENALRFMALATENLATVAVFLIIGTSIFWRALHSSIAAAEAIRSSERQYRALFEQTNDAVSLINLEGIYLAVNSRTAEMFGYSIDELIGKSVPDLIVSQEHAESQQILTALKMGQKLSPYERRFRQKDGSEFIGEVSVSLVRDATTGQPLHMLSIVRDVAERKQVEQQRLELALERERTTLLREFIGNISHDFKTPLTIINTSLYLFEKLTDPAKQKSRLEVIKQQIVHLDRLIQDILTASKLDYTIELTCTSVDVNALIRNLATLFQPLAEKKNLQLHLNLAADLPPLFADEEKLYDAIENLIGNALRYTLDTGQVTIQTYQQGQGTVILISDTGIGINEEDLPHIFERFFRADRARATEKGGTGLGLAIAKQVIDLHHGQITVESKPGLGSTFTVTFPSTQ